MPPRIYSGNEKERKRQSLKKYRQTAEGKRKYNKIDKKYRHSAKGKETAQKYYQVHKTEKSEYGKKYRQSERGKAAYKRYSHSEHGRKQIIKRNLKNNYGITVEQYDQMFYEQNGACAICSKKETRRNQYGLCRLSVDHDHKTGKVRGLLCKNCNIALGSLFVDEKGLELLLNAIEYLREEPE